MSEATIATGRVRTWIGAVGAPLSFVVLWLAPLPLETSAHRLAAIFAAVVVLWVTEVVSIAATALLVAPLLVICDVAAPKDAFKHYADPLLYLFVGGFMIAEAMRKHGLDRRIAKSIVGSRWVRGVPVRGRMALLVAGLLISMWISNTAATAMLLPICLGMVGPARGDDPHGSLRGGTASRHLQTTQGSAYRPAAPLLDRGAAGALLVVAHSCSIGGLGTMIGSPPNLITVRLLAEGGVSFGFMEWLAIGLPAALLLLGALFAITQWLLPAPKPGDEPRGAASLFDDVPATWTRGEALTAVAFGLAVLGWTVPGIASLVAPAEAPALRRFLDPGVVAVLAASVLFFAPDGRGSRVLRWSEAVRIDWGIILLFGGGIALGTQLVDTGLAAVMSEAFVASTGVSDVWTLTILCIVATIVLSELCSNTATATMLVPLVIGVTTELGVSPIAPVLAVGLAASVGFMLPIATGPNALVYGTGRVSQMQMMRVGLALDVAGGVIVFAVVRVLCPLFGWT